MKDKIVRLLFKENTRMNTNTKEIYFAGGCFWGTQRFFSSISGVIKTEVGYANGFTTNPTYEEVCSGNTGHAETVRVLYDPDKVLLDDILKKFYMVIDPTIRNRQGADVGTQYRTGIYFTDDRDLNVIKPSIKELQKEYQRPIVVEVLPLRIFYSAEEYHQKYLQKNPGGYCHISEEC